MKGRRWAVAAALWIAIAGTSFGRQPAGTVVRSSPRAWSDGPTWSAARCSWTTGWRIMCPAPDRRMTSSSSSGLRSPSESLAVCGRRRTRGSRPRSSRASWSATAAGWSAGSRAWSSSPATWSGSRPRWTGSRRGTSRRGGPGRGGPSAVQPEFKDDALMRRAKALEAEAMRLEGDTKRLAVDAPQEWLDRAIEARRRNVPEPEPSAWAHRAFTPAWPRPPTCRRYSRWSGRYDRSSRQRPRIGPPAG